MNLATLRVRGSDEALELLIRELDLEVDARWKKGEPRFRGAWHLSSGSSALIADATSTEMVLAVHEFLAECEARRITFAASDLEAEIAIGVTVAEPQQYIGIVNFPAADLRLMGLMGLIGLRLSVAAYPSADEAAPVRGPDDA